MNVAHPPNLFGLVVLLFAVLIGFTSYWSVFDADGLEANQANKRPLLEQQRIRRGLISPATAPVLARNTSRGTGSARFYRRIYPDRPLVLASGGIQLRGARPRRGSSATTTTI